jgi:MoaD family protein
MLVRVRFVGSLRSFSGKSKLTFDVAKASTVKQAIDKIVEKKPRARKALVDAELDDPRPLVLILVNEREISVLDGLDTVLKEGDEMVIVPVVHGG